MPVPAPEAAATPAPADDTALQTLITVLKDDAARQRLIDELEAQVAPAAAAPAVTEEAATPDAISIGNRIGDVTQQTAEMAADSVQRFWRQLMGVPHLFSLLGRSDYSNIASMLADLAFLVATTYLIFLLARLLTERFRNNLKLRGVHSGWFAAVLAVLVLLITNLLLVVAAWAVGYIVALSLLGEGGRIAYHHTLFLNAFLVAEAVQAVIGALLSPRRAELRLVPVDDATANMLTRWLRITVSILAFGVLLVVPLFTRYVAFGAGAAASALIYLVVLGLVLNLVLRLKEPVTQWLVARTGNSDNQLLRFLARYWHVPVILYVLALMVVALTRPEWVLARMLAATFSIAVAIIIGMVAAGLLTRLIMAGVKLPPTFSSRVPLLERRLNAFVPRVLTVLRLVVVLAVAGYAIDTIGIFDVSGWLESDFGLRMSSAFITIFIIAVLAFLAWLTLNSYVDHRLEPRGRRTAAIKARERTLLTLMRNALTIAIIVFAGMFILSEIGINIAPLLASAGVIGLAIGFGAQKLVQDIITGIFIQLEGAIDVGDGVTIGGISGSVERLTIRSAGLRDLHGTYHIVPFSSVTTVSNGNRGFSFAVFDLNVAYREDLADVRKAMFDAYAEVKANEALAPDIIDELEWMGLEKFGENGITVRARIKTLAARQWGVTRAYNAIVKRIFEERDIAIPFPHQTVYFGEDVKGNAPPLHLFAEQSDPAAKAEEAKKPAPRRRARKTPIDMPVAEVTSDNRKRKPQVPPPAAGQAGSGTEDSGNPGS
ncbi:MAG TPA: mechanosensitive ion channel domain-containing protein [Devosiaceae bacterium]